ncbi:MAG: spermidine/putrescine ABC transporter permease [Planctomycetes bacterium GWF2_41_51]|nr:MAG: spermidine/putrescine ABC transporter permease [Planctomycetes bacterium GWF2_41_51]
MFKGLIFISPWIIGFALFQLYPIYKSIYYSFCQYDVLNPPIFIGLKNYSNLFQDEIFLKSIVSTGIYTIMAIPLSMIVSLFFAILLNQKIFGRGIFRTIYFLPSLVPMVALAILWKWMFNGEHGILNYILGLFGIPGPNWLGSTMWATPSIVLTGLWGVGGSIVIYLAALQDVPRSLYEAAEIDGAGWFSKTRHITIPMISPVIYFNLILGIIGCLQVFAVPYIMTAGGPARSTYYYTMYLFDNAFSFLKMGYAGAMAVLLFIIILAITFIVTKMTTSRVYYAEK